MAIIDTDRIVSVTKANERGVSALVADALSHGYAVISRHNRPEVAVVPIERFSQFEEAEADARDLLVALTRMAEDDGSRTPLDDVLAKFGVTREELEALPD